MTSSRYRYEVSCADDSGGSTRSNHDAAGLVRKVRWCVRQVRVVKVSIERQDLADLILDYRVDADESEGGPGSQSAEPVAATIDLIRAAIIR